MKKGYRDNVKPILKRDFGDGLFQGTIKEQILILPELKSLIPPLLTDESEQLEANILQLGCREPLLVWKTTADKIGKEGSREVYVLIDGHNRYGICQKHGLDFNILLQSFETLDAVKDFMIDNQLGRRNLNPEQMSYLRGLKYLAAKKKPGKGEKKTKPDDTILAKETGVSPESESLRTAEIMAEQYGVSPRTIRNDASFAKGIDKLSDSLKQEVLSRKVKVNKKAIAALGDSAEPVSAITTLDDLEQIAGGEPTPAAEPTVLAKASAKKRKEVERAIEQISQLAGTLQYGSPTLLKQCQDIISNAQKVMKHVGNL